MSWIPTLEPASSTPLHLQIRKGVRQAVRNGELQPGEQLMGIRAMAAALGVNRLTVLKAVQALSRAGVVETVRGKGVFVGPPQRGLGARPPELDGPFFEGIAEGPGDDAEDAVTADSIRATVDDMLRSGDHVAFAAGFPPADTVPRDTIRKRLHQLLRGDAGAAALGYASTLGAPELRAALAGLLASRGAPLGEDDRVLVTGGAQQGIALCLQALLRPGAALAIETPGYMGAIAAGRLLGIPLVPVAVDHGGLNPERLETALKRHDVGAIYTVPDFQNPTGVTQGIRRRRRLLELAARHEALVIEDAVYSDLRFGRRTVPPLKSLPGGERVLHVSSFSKALAPGIRVGYVMARAPLVDALRRVKEVTDICTGRLPQTLVADLVASGFYRRHVARMRRIYRERRDVMVAALAEHLPPSARFTRPKGGMHLWVMLAQRVDAARLNRRAAEHGVSFAPGALFFPDGRRASSFRLNFSSHAPDLIREGIRRLGRCLATLEDEP